MRSAFLHPGDLRWSALLEEVPHDAYHLPGYALLCAGQEHARAMAFWAEEDDAALLIPLLLRPVPAQLQAPDGLQDAVSPYGYPTPLLRGEPGPVHARLFARFVEAGAAAGLVTAFLRLHPLLPLPRALLPEEATRVERGHTLYADLRQDWTALERGMRAGCRYDVRRLAREGFHVRFDQWEDYPTFAAMYRATMARVGAAEHYLFSDGYFRGLRLALGEHLHLGTVSAADGTPAAGALFFETCGVVQYHLSGTAAPFVRQAPTKLLLHAALRWAQARGDHLFHLGGGVGSRADSLSHFKAGFSEQRASFATVQVVLQPRRYQELLRRWQALAGAHGEAEEAYFPRYRQPLPAQPQAADAVP